MKKQKKKIPAFDQTGSLIYDIDNEIYPKENAKEKILIYTKTWQY